MRFPPGVSRYPRVPLSRSDAEPAAPLALVPAVAPATGVHWSPTAAAEYTAKLVQWAAKPEPVPVHRAHTAQTRSPRASSAVTRSPPVLIFAQVWPPSCVANNSGPNAQPLSGFRNRI